jgi:hypothetical protein
MAKRKATGRKGTGARAKSTGAAKRSGNRPKKSVAKSASRPRKAAARSGGAKKARRASAAARPARAKTSKKAGGTRKAAATTRRAAKPSTNKAATRRPPALAAAPNRVARIDRQRRQLEESVPTPPSSLDMKRHGSAARTGRAEMAENRADLATMTPAITGGDVDVDLENAYFSGDEAPGGDNPTPDQDIVDDIGRALGVEYQDNEELQGADKVTERDKHRWELDPASSEDYRDRK